MKRFGLIMTLAASLVLVAAFAAHAVEVTVNGTFDFNFGFYDNPDGFSSNMDRAIRPSNTLGAGISAGRRTYTQAAYNKAGSARGTEEHFQAIQRVRTQINFIASENVQGVLFFEIGETNWGAGNGSMAQSAAANNIGGAAGATRVGSGGGGAIGTDGINIKTRRAYIDFNIPNTELLFRVGLQGLAGPAAVAGSPVVGSSGTDMAAILGIYKINDMISVAAFWARPWNTTTAIDNTILAANHINDEIDIVGLLVPVTMKGIGSFTPYFMFANMGTDAVAQSYNGGTLTAGFPGLYTNALGANIFTAQNGLLRSKYMNAWWLGGAFEFTMLDPLTFGADVVYGAVDHMSSGYLNRSGWYLAGKIAYKTPWVTPTLIGWWSTGDDNNMWNGSERLPSLDADFNATTFGFSGTGLGGGNTLTSANYGMASRSDRFDSSAAGTWGVALQLNNISFIEDLSHQIILAYIGGTNSTRSMQDRRAQFARPWNPYYNNPSSIYLTTADSMWEIDFNTKYQMYENLAVFVEMGMFDIQRQAYPWRTPENRLNSGFYNASALKLWETSTAWKLMFGLQYKF